MPDQLRILFAVLFLLAGLPDHATAGPYDAALELKRAGRFAEAAQQFRALTEADGANAAVWYQLGTLQRFRQDFDGAMRSQIRALRLSPDNQDIRLELARLHYFAGDYDQAGRLLTQVLAAVPDYEAARDMADAIARAENAPPPKAPFRWQMDFGLERSRFSRLPRPDWRGGFLQIGLRLADATQLQFRVENARRNDVINRQYTAGFTHIFSESRNGHFSVGYAPASEFLPEWRIRTGGAVRLAERAASDGGTWAVVDIQHDRYETLDTTIIKPGLRHALTPALQGEARLLTVVDERASILFGWSGRLDWQTPHPRLQLFAGASVAPETVGRRTVRTAAWFAGFICQISDRVVWRGSFAREDRENSFVRTIIASSVSVRF